MKNVLLFIVLTSIIFQLKSQDNYSYFKNSFDSILENNPIPLIDSDKDGIDDEMEREIGTNTLNKDSDEDGLDDYEEVFKYKTNPLLKDSDMDGLIDSVWAERYEFTYVLQITANVGQPFTNEPMSTMSLDSRIVEEFSEHVKMEYIVYPFAEPYLVPLKSTQNVKYQEKYLEVDTFTELSTGHVDEIMNVIKDAQSDLEKAILLINYIWENYELKDELFSQCEPFMEIMIKDSEIVHVHKGWSPEQLHLKYDFPTILDLNCIADKMIQFKSRGACGSTATLVAGIFKNAGIPTRIKQNFPFITDKDSSQIKFIDSIRNENAILEKYREGMYGDNHFFNEVFINGHWIDLDTYRLGNKWIYKPYLKSVHFSNWSNINFAETWDSWVNYDKKSRESLDKRYKAYKTISINEIYPKY